jgi:hypothetical protein
MRTKDVRLAWRGAASVPRAAGHSAPIAERVT